MEERSNLFIFLLIGILLGAGVIWGYFKVQSQSERTISNTHSEMGYYQALGYKIHDPTTHGVVETDPEKPIPSVSFELKEDAMSGYNVVISTENFTFTPERASELSQINNEGHAHIIVNGYKIDRLYGSYYHLKPNLLQPGENEITVSLNANDHADWTLDEKAVKATQMFTPEASDDTSTVEGM